MTNQISRRDALMCLATAAGALVSIEAASAAAEKPHLTADDPTAKALGYMEDAAKADPVKNPPYQAGQMCSNCLQSTGGTPTDLWRPCNLFPNKLVNSKGWCKVYIAKPAA
jgi:hypothetical protein